MLVRRHFFLGGLAVSVLPGISQAAAMPSRLDSDFASGRMRTLLTVQPREIGQFMQGMAVDPAGRRVAAFGPTQADLSLIDIETAEILFRGKVSPLAASIRPDQAIVFSGDGKTLYWASGGTSGLGLVCFDLKTHSVLGVHDVGEFQCQGMLTYADSAYFRAPDFSIIKVGLADGKYAKLDGIEHIAALVKANDGVYGRLPNFTSIGDLQHPADGLPMNANRPAHLFGLSPEIFGRRLTLPAVAGVCFFEHLQDGRWAMASDEDFSLPAGEIEHLIIADAAGKLLSNTPFGRGSLPLNGFTSAAGRLFACAENDPLSLFEFSMDGQLIASTRFENGRQGALGIQGAGDKLVVMGMYEVVVIG